MSRAHIVKNVDIVRTPRLMQMEGLFDVPPSQRSGEEWNVDLALPEQWNVGLIVGPSGSGKTTIARELFGDHMAERWEWPQHKSILDGFPQTMGIKEIVELLSSVGFSSPPSWVRPFHALSNGEQFRVNMARTLAESKELAVVDEFTSVVDRTVAQIGSAAIAKTVRRRNQRFVAVSCHYDIAEWLEPDWIYQPHTNELQIGRLLRRPKIELTVRRVHSSAWQLFRKHHYLDTKLHVSATCWCAFVGDVPVAFTGILHMPHPQSKNLKREHRTVCLPDFQGVGIGNALSGYVGAMCKGMGYRFLSQTSHPGMMRYRASSPAWSMRGKPTAMGKKFPKYVPGLQFADRGRADAHIANRVVASFEYVGPALDKDEAQHVWSGS